MMFKQGIKFRLLLLGVLPAALIGLILAAYFVRARVADLDSSLREHGDLIARQLATAAVSGLISRDQMHLQDLADATLQENDVTEVDIFDHTKPIAASRREQSETRAGKSGDQLVFVAPILLKPLPPNSRIESDIQAPSPQSRASEATTLGNVRLVLSRSETLQRQRDTLVYSFCIVLGGLLLTALLAHRMGKKISSPILALATAVHALSKGRMDTRAEFQAEAELAYLQAGFNAMAAELQKNRQNLEHQVQRATSQLQDTLKSLEMRNAELEAARQRAETQTELKSQFLAQMSHEIRTPMNGILGFAELLAKTPLTEEQTDQLRLIERSAKNLLAIINEILDLSKLEAGKVSLNIHQFMLRPYLEDAIALLGPRATHLPVILWIEPSVPKTILGDPIRIQQVVSNLLGNALKFTRRGRIVIRVRLQSTRQQKRVLFSVSDSGSGISPQDMDHLFSPFLQLSAYAIEHERGAGLGLTIAKNIVDRMKGTIRVASRLGKGTTFWFSLPLVLEETGAKPAPAFAAALVDGNALSREALRYQLEDLGAAVTVFASFDDYTRNYVAEKHGGFVVFNALSLQETMEMPLTRWLEQSRTKYAKPVLILPNGDQRLLDFYRQQGAICLSQPVRTESLRAALRSPVQDRKKGSANLVKPESPHCGKTFLVADDNEINRILLRAQLARLGANITEAQDGQEALELIMTKPFDLIFLDLQMPIMDGLSVMRELRGTPGVNHNTPVIAVTAHAQPEQKEAILRNGFADCLIKPVMENQLLELINVQLGVGRNQFPEREKMPLPSPDLYVRALLENTNGDRELAGVIARKLFQELPEQLQGIHKALLDQELETAQRITHKIHGSAGFCGLTELRQAAAALESHLIQEASPDALPDLHQALAQEIDRLTAHEAAILGGLAQVDRGEPEKF